MTRRIAIIIGLAAFAAAWTTDGLCDKLHMKDGTVVICEIYHETATYITYIYGEEKLGGCARTQIKRIEYEEEDRFDVKAVLAKKAAAKRAASMSKNRRELTALEKLLQQAADRKSTKTGDAEAKKKQKEVELLEKAFNPSASKAKTTKAPAAPNPGAAAAKIRGVDVVPAGTSQTGETEMIVDPFPDGNRRRR